MYKIGVVGERDSVLAFLALGIDVKPVETNDDAAKTLDSMAKEGYGVIYITETMAQGIENTIRKYDRFLTPAIIPIPGSRGSLGIGLARIKENVEKAVGIDILSKKEG